MTHLPSLVDRLRATTLPTVTLPPLGEEPMATLTAPRTDHEATTLAALREVWPGEWSRLTGGDRPYILRGEVGLTVHLRGKGARILYRGGGLTTSDALGALKAMRVGMGLATPKATRDRLALVMNHLRDGNVALVGLELGRLEQLLGMEWK